MMKVGERGCHFDRKRKQVTNLVFLKIYHIVSAFKSKYRLSKGHYRLFLCIENFDDPVHADKLE